MDPILEAIEESSRAFVQFKGDINQRLRELEKLEAKLTNRPGNGGFEAQGTGSLARELAGNAPNSIVVPSTPEVKAFARYLTRGEERDLKALAVGTNGGADGGYAVPKEINSAIESILLRQSPIRRYASVVQAISGDFHKLVSDRGWAQGWATETGARTATTTAKLTDVKIPVFEQYAFPQATQVMLDDVFFDAGTWIANEIGLIFAERESAAFVSGDGTTQPAGILTAPVSAVADYGARPQGTLEYLPTGAAATFIASSASAGPTDVLLDCIAHMKPGYRANGGAAWFMHPSTLSFLQKVRDLQGRPIVLASLIAGEPQTLLGYEVVEVDHLDQIGANKYPIMFANLKRGYLVVDRPGVGVLRDPFTNKPYTGFYSTARVGGAIVNSECIKLIKCSVS